MSTPTISSRIGRLAVIAACVLATTSCGGDMLRTGRAPFFLVIDSVLVTPGGEGEESSGSLLSDVQPVFNDIGEFTFRSEPKNASALVTTLNDITLTRYRVTYTRTDGRNTPGVDVPYGFDGGIAVTVPAGGIGVATLDIVRHQAKLEPPLKNLAGLGGQVFISTITEVTFYGHDQNGNEVTVTGRVTTQFADFADEE
jgi:hypothetical protein